MQQLVDVVRCAGRDYMLRFSKNRCWILILTSCLCFACVASRPGPARAEGPCLISDDIPWSNYGDPDLPTGPSKTAGGRGQVQPGGRMDPVRTLGDGRVTVRVVMWRLLVMVRGLGSFYFRF
jgi:hypothetical protein